MVIFILLLRVTTLLSIAWRVYFPKEGYFKFYGSILPYIVLHILRLRESFDIIQRDNNIMNIIITL